MTADGADVVIVGGGIAGASLGTVLAREGLDVVVLEQQTQYKDRVRGESMLPWGVKEAQQLGLYDVLMDAGAHHTAEVVNYSDVTDPAAAEALPLPIGSMVPGVPGSLNMQHRLACEALAAAAEKGGAKLVRGVRSVEVSSGSAPEVTFGTDGTSATLSARLVVGADGRASTVRHQIGIELERQAPPHFMAGLLVRDLDIPDRDFLATEGDLALFAFVQNDGWARVYATPSNEQRQRFAGPDGPAELLSSAAAFTCFPFPDAFGKARAAGPCATYPGDDTWTDTPFVDGVVLVGDAAGHNNPVIGQGLSLAMRDIGLVSGLVLGNSTWSSELFVGYGQERCERMRRARFAANYVATLVADFSPRGRARRAAFGDALMSDFSYLAPLLTVYTGPHEADAELFEPSKMDRLIGLGA
jgi:menaquinone-9 beta-reductase